MMKNKYIRVILFLLIFSVIFSFVSKTLTAPSDYDNFQRIRGFYEEEEDTLDAIYIGSSNCFAFWNAMAAWGEYGIAVYSYASNDQPLFIAEELIKETRKTQSNAKYIININTIKEDKITEAMLHYLLDYMPFSLNKIAITNRMADKGGYTFVERLEYFVPMLRYHSRWNDLSKKDFSYNNHGVKGTSHYKRYLYTSDDISDLYLRSENTKEVSEDIVSYVNSLLDYCDQENIEVVFVAVPQARKYVEQIEEYNMILDIIEQRGYDTVSTVSNPEELGLDLTKDFYDKYHTNIHGSLKFTEYLASYLVERFQFEDKRNHDAYKSWDAGYEKYLKYATAGALDIEFDLDKRNFDLLAVNDVTVNVNDGIELKWDAIDAADGYAVYRKDEKDTLWKRVALIDTTSFKDSNIKSNIEYNYRVVPYQVVDNETYYGDFDYEGIKVNS